MQNQNVLSDFLFVNMGALQRTVSKIVLVILGIGLLVATAKVKIPLPPSPVPITLTTFAVLSIGASYGARLGFVTIAGYLAIGMLGFDVFANSSDANGGLEYMLGGTGGYLVGFLLASIFLGWSAKRGWDRSPMKMAAAMLAGNALIYIPGLLWLRDFANSWAQTLDWGFWPFLVGDGLKLALAAIIFPATWKLVRSMREQS